MADARKIVLGMETAVNETAELAAALRRLAFTNFEEGLVEAERAGLYQIAFIVQQRSEHVLAAWRELEVATGPNRGAR